MNNPSGGDAGSHGDDPLGLRHLFVEALDHRGHLLGDSAGYDHDIGLAGRGSERLAAEAGDLVVGDSAVHHLDGAAGQAKGQRPG